VTKKKTVAAWSSLTASKGSVHQTISLGIENRRKKQTHRRRGTVRLWKETEGTREVEPTEQNRACRSRRTVAYPSRVDWKKRGKGSSNTTPHSIKKSIFHKVKENLIGPLPLDCLGKRGKNGGLGGLWELIVRTSVKRREKGTLTVRKGKVSGGERNKKAISNAHGH